MRREKLFVLTILFCFAAPVLAGNVDLAMIGIVVLYDGDDIIIKASIAISQDNSVEEYSFDVRYEVNDELECSPAAGVSENILACPAPPCESASCSMWANDRIVYGTCNLDADVCSCDTVTTLTSCRIVGGLSAGDEIKVTIDPLDEISETNENNNVYVTVY